MNIDRLLQRVEREKNQDGQRRPFTPTEHSALEDARVQAGLASKTVSDAILRLAYSDPYAKRAVEDSRLAYGRFHRIARALDWH